MPVYQYTADLALSWGSLQKTLQLALKLTNMASVQRIKIETKWHSVKAPGPPKERVWEGQNVKKACFTSMGKHTTQECKLHKGREHVLFTALHPLYHRTHGHNAGHRVE